MKRYVANLSPFKRMIGPNIANMFVRWFKNQAYRYPDLVGTVRGHKLDMFILNSLYDCLTEIASSKARLLYPNPVVVLITTITHQSLDAIKGPQHALALEAGG
ncbi:hypothetical protein FALBO_1275 [Fusarium albosuccineum]|uniref:Uncharacterized protein n=1 Tax=Fusarium albosuccineum TaxID=1237068 RepID=A0A8H4LM89_9HYPO|nr:hypothetical protein FALBO_1275 [Fusarium albosuccineum]